MRRLSPALLLPLLALSCSDGQAAPKRHFLWKVSAESGHDYLLGSIHVAKKELYPLAPEIEKAFEASKILAVEADQAKLDPGVLRQMIAERGLYKEGESLSKALPPDRAKKALELAAKVGLPAERAERMKPWYLALTASMTRVQAAGFDPKLGIDQHFMDKARATGKPILELESPRFQLDLLSGFSDELQALFIESTLEDLDQVEKKMAEIFELWTRGDAAALEKVVLTEGLNKKPEMAPLRYKLFDERNLAMAAKVEGYLKSPDVHFVIMGAGHLLGENGVAEILRRKGYKVEQIESK
jgi:uncharacterized protein YbaP (TraB family)